MNSYYDTHPLNLATLASRAAIELDRGVQGIDDQYTSVYKLSEILQGQLMPDTSMTLYRAIIKDSGKELRLMNELDLEIHLLQLEMSDVDSLPKGRLEVLRGACVDICREFLSEDCSYIRRAA